MEDFTDNINNIPQDKDNKPVKENNRFFSLSVLLPVIIAIAFVGGWLVNLWISDSHGNTQAEKKLNNILDLIETEYVDDINLDSLLEYALPGIMTTLDPHSAYISKADLKSVNEDIEGSFSGIGVSFMMNNDTIVVIEVIAGGPAEKVGIIAGDRIVTVDGETVAGKGISDDNVKSMLRGAANTVVKLGIKRQNSKKTYDYDVTRGEIPNVSIDAEYLVADSIGYIKVNKFSRTTYSEFITALNSLTINGATSFIIDLRGNGGGVMDASIFMANEFLSRGDVIMVQKGRETQDEQRYISDGYGNYQEAPLVVLIDEYSASSSEIFAGAIQDNDRGLVIGRRSFGKGLIQTQVTLPDSSALRLTIARYYTPSGRCIQKPYKFGQTSVYDNDIIERYNSGEAFSEDSIKLNTDEVYSTVHGRTVYGGGGIMPDIFVPEDTSGYTGYYLNVVNSGLLQRFAFEYCDLNREELLSAKGLNDLLDKLPPEYILLRSFVQYAATHGVPARWYYINISHDLIINQLQALIARDILGRSAFYEIYNQRDPNVKRAIKEIKNGRVGFPIKSSINLINE